MLTNAVRLSSSKVCVLLLYFWTLTRRLQAGFRNYYYSTNKVTWETHRSFFWSGSYKPYIDFNYLTCDVNAICSNGNCVCSQYYSGTGVACTCAYFGGRTWLLTIYSFRFCLRDCLHGQRKLPQVGHRHHRCGHLLASVRRKSDGCLQQQGLGFRSKPLRVCVLNRSLWVNLLILLILYSVDLPRRCQRPRQRQLPSCERRHHCHGYLCFWLFWFGFACL